MANTSLRRLVLAGSILLLTVFLALPQAARGEGSTARPRYAPNHDLLLPVGFENWVFVGSNLGLVYDAELPLTTSLEAARAAQQVFHNIYIDPEAYEYFKTNKEFPDPTMLVMDMYSAEERAPRDVLAEGVFNGAHTGLQVAVKDTRRPGPSTTPWAYYIFTDFSDPTQVRAQAQAFADSECFACHLEHASKDNVWVQFYPVLRNLLE